MAESGQGCQRIWLHHRGLRGAPPSTSAMRRRTRSVTSVGRASIAKKPCSRTSMFLPRTAPFCPAPPPPPAPARKVPAMPIAQPDQQNMTVGAQHQALGAHGKPAPEAPVALHGLDHELPGHLL